MIRSPHPATFLAALLALALCTTTAVAQDVAPEVQPETPIAADADRSTDERIAARLEGIFAEIEALDGLTVEVTEGVVTISGEVAGEANAASALRIAKRMEGAVTVEDQIERSVDLEQNLTPKLAKYRADFAKLVRALPLLLLALGTAIAIGLFGHFLAKWRWLWGKIAPNVFLADLLSHAVRVVFIILGIIVALNLLNASALIGTVLGGAGVLGLAIGFAVRDTMENYISSIMLSLRQPFRAGDYVRVGDQEGAVIRLTSRATILMTSNGNHLRIPNSTVFKAVILNYTRNPDRRFSYQLGVGAGDDPLDAIERGTAAIGALPFVLSEPKPKGVIDTVGDSNIVLTFTGWVDQTETDFSTGRSLAIHATKDTLEAAGFTLPEPVYRLRFDGTAPGLSEGAPTAAVEQTSPAVRKPAPAADDPEIDTRPETHLTDKVAEERSQSEDADLLDSELPIE